MPKQYAPVTTSQDPRPPYRRGLNETLVHGWDLATATGQDPEADPEVVAPVLAIAAQVVPAEPRGGPIPFAPVVEPAADAGPTERLANWNGSPRVRP